MIRPPSTGRRARVDAAAAADMQWREREAVRAACRAWPAASASGESLVFEAYQTALDHEECVAKTYAGLMSRIRHLSETSPAHPPAWLHFIAGAGSR